MQETRNNCFGPKKCSTTLRQTKTGKHECRNVTATKGRATFVQPEATVASFSHRIVLFFKVIFNNIVDIFLFTYFRDLIFIVMALSTKTSFSFVFEMK